MARTIKLTLQYDGTEYVGWQRQAQGSSIQGLLEDALARIEGRAVTVTGAGRTDAGVHALGQVAGVVLDHGIDCVDLQRALNAMLPDAVRIVDAAEVGAGFHPRFDAASKTYRYVIVNAPVVSPFEVRYAWHVPVPLDVDRMREGLDALEGTHDFAAFQSAGSDVKTTVRTVTEAAVDAEAVAGPGALAGVRVSVTLSADGFLRHMVRAIAGTLVEVGTGRRGADEMVRILASRDRALAGRTAPARGLWLVRVTYGPTAGRSGHRSVEGCP
jgi:tRNA pseudouridine38-40 synthase